MRRPSLIIVLALASAACLKPAPPPAAPPPEVVSGTATVSLATLPAATVSAWTGTWRSGGRTLEVVRAGDMLMAGGQPLTLVGLGTFADAAGTAYLFGPAELRTYTAAGAETRWTR